MGSFHQLRLQHQLQLQQRQKNQLRLCLFVQNIMSIIVHMNGVKKKHHDGGYHCKDHDGCRSVEQGPFPDVDCQDQCAFGNHIKPCPHDHEHQCPASWTDGGYHCLDHDGCRHVNQGPFTKRDCKEECFIVVSSAPAPTPAPAATTTEEPAPPETTAEEEEASTTAEADTESTTKS